MKIGNGIKVRRFCIGFVLLCFFGCVIRPPVQGPRELKVDGPFTHFRTNMIFPERIGEYERVSVVRYVPDSNDISVGYNISAMDLHITATIYLTNSALFNWKTNDTLQENYDDVIYSIKASYNEVKEVTNSEITFQNKYKGKKGILLFKFPHDNIITQSEVRLFYINGWLLKFRISYPVEISDYVTKEINFLVKYFEEKYGG